MAKPKLLRITTVPISLHLLLHGQLKFMQLQGFELLAVSANGPEVNEITKLGIPHTVVSFSRKITPIQDFFCLLRLAFIIIKFKPDIVHTHTPKAGLLGMLAAWFCRVPVRLHTVAGLPLMESAGFKRWMLIKTEQISYACATRVYPNSIALRDYINSNIKTQKSKLSIIGKGSTNGVDLAYFQKSGVLKNLELEKRNMYGIGQDDYVYCFVGRVVMDKGIVELVESFVDMANREKGVWLLIIGHFEDELDPLPEIIKSKILDHPKIIHPGFQRDIRPWILASNVFVLPSYREGFPNVVLQAGCLEKPCIVSDINGCNEIIANNESGVLVPVRNAPALLEAMIYLLRNREKGNQMGKEARKRIATDFDQSYIWHELLKEYQNQMSTCI